MSDFDEQYDNAGLIERPAPLPLRRKSAPPEAFPVKALGKVLSGAAFAIMDKVQCPDAIAGQSVLAAAALAVQAHADVVHPATGDAHPLSLFLVTVAASGERKTAADKIALDPVKLREAELHDAYEADKRHYLDAQAAYQRAREVILRKCKGDAGEAKRQLAELGPAPRSPLLPMLTAPDPTIEGLHKLLSESEPSMGLFSDEGGSFLGGYGMSDDSRMRTSAGLSSFWDGSAVKRVRGGDGASILRGRRLSVHIMIQPAIAGGLLADPIVQGQGLASRFLVAAPESLAGTRMQKPPKATTVPALAKYRKAMLNLLRKKQPRKMGIAELDPPALVLSPEAREKWVAYTDECESELGPKGWLEPIRAFAGKLAEHALRIAGIFELVDDSASAEISAESFERAITLCRFYASEALRLFDEGELSVEIHRAEKVLRWLHEGWGKPRVGLSHVYQYGPNAIREAVLARQAMEILERHYWAVKIEGGAKIDGKHHREAWEIVTA